MIKITVGTPLLKSGMCLSLIYYYEKYKKMKLKRQKYYMFPVVQFELASIMRDREITFMDKEDNWKCIRGIFIKTKDILEKQFDNFNFYDRNYNIYVSRGKFKTIPLFTLNLKERSNETIKWFNGKDYIKDCYSYDMLIDFDAKDVLQYHSMKKEYEYMITKLYRDKVCFKTFPSGSNFQIIIPFDNFKFDIDTDLKDWQKYQAILYQKIINKFRFKHLDKRGAWVKIYKCSYSLVDDKVILPFKDFSSFLYTIKTFTYEDVDSSYVIKSVRLKFRGDGLINNFSKGENQHNFNNFLIKNKLK